MTSDPANTESAEPGVTTLLERAARGDSSAANELLPLVYQQLRAIAQQLVTIEFAAANAKFVGTTNEQLDQSVGKWMRGGQEYDFTINKIPNPN